MQIYWARFVLRILRFYYFCIFCSIKPEKPSGLIKNKKSQLTMILCDEFDSDTKLGA